jgi:hypothetical protein
MKEIQPFTIWVNGKTIIANYMALICNNDNLINQAVFYWAFYDKIEDKAGNKLTDGNITMISPDYDLWDSNDFAWSWAASTLGVTITGATIGEGPAVVKKGKAKTV